MAEGSARSSAGRPHDVDHGQHYGLAERKRPDPIEVGWSGRNDYLATLEVMDAMTSEAIPKASSRSVIPWRRAM
jgi:hypothetical protein